MTMDYDPLLNPSILDLCREDPGIELAIRRRYPAAGDGDVEWQRATVKEVRARAQEAYDAAVARELILITAALEALADSGECWPEDEVALVSDGDCSLH